MEKFRNLTNNIFFKIFLGFLGLTFVIFGVSDFLLNGGNSWVAKINGKKIAYSELVQSMQNDREVIYRANPNEEALKYLDSAQFKNDVLGRMVTSKLVSALKDDFQIFADRKIILKQISEEAEFKGKDGKFDRKLYEEFLAKNNFKNNEEKYLTLVENEIIGTMIIGSLSQVTSTSYDFTKELYKHNEEKRSADIVTISTRNVGAISAPNDFELNDFFEKNKAAFALPEMRKVSYIAFDDRDLSSKINIEESELEKEYNNDISSYQIAETKDFYHLVFSDEKEANEFLTQLKSSEKASPEAFAKLAFELKKKDLKSITLQKIKKEDLLKEISSAAFSVEKNNYSAAVKSPLGYHVFYLLNTNPASQIPFAEVKNKIKTKLTAAKEENAAKDKLGEIDDELLSSNSLEKTAVKFNLKINNNLPEFNMEGSNYKHEKISEIAAFDEFTANSFKLPKEQVSKLFFSKTNGKYYAIFVEKIEPKRDRSLDEVKALATDIWTKNKKQEKFQELANQVASELKENGGESASVVAKYRLKLEKSREFPRTYIIDAGGGRKMPYASKFQNELFSLDIGQPTSAYRVSNDEFSIGVVRKITPPAENKNETEGLKKEIANSFKNDILVQYNKHIQGKFPVEINQKLLQTSDKDKQQ